MTYQMGTARFSAGRIALALLSTLALFMVFAFTSARIAHADGSGSPAACETEDKLTPAGGGDEADDSPARSVTITADEGEVITAICIKSGNNMFDGNKHSGVISSDGLYDDCYTVAGLGTAEVTVTAGEAGPDCQGISHVDYTTGGAPGDDDDDTGDDDDDDDDTGDDDDDDTGDDDDDTGDDDDDTGDDDDDDDDVAGGGPTPGEGTLGGNPTPDTAVPAPVDAVVPTLVGLFVLAAFGGLTALRLARRP